MKRIGAVAAAVMVWSSGAAAQDGASRLDEARATEQSAPAEAPLPRRSSDEIIRFTIGADDRVGNCVVTVDGADVTARHPACATMTNMPAAALRRLTGGTVAGQPVDVTMERIVQFEGSPPIAEAFAAPGLTTALLRRVAFDLTPAGDRVNARAVETRGAVLPDPTDDLGRFEAAPGRTDHLVVTSAVATASR